MVSTANERYKIDWWASRGLPAVVDIWEEDTVNAGGVVVNRFIKWVAGTYSFTANYDKALMGPQDVLQDAANNLHIAVQFTPYYEDPKPAPPPELPKPAPPRYDTEVIDATHQVEHDGPRKRMRTWMPFGWAVGPWE